MILVPSLRRGCPCCLICSIVHSYIIEISSINIQYISCLLIRPGECVYIMNGNGEPMRGRCLLSIRLPEHSHWPDNGLVLLASIQCRSTAGQHAHRDIDTGCSVTHFFIITIQRSTTCARTCMIRGYDYDKE